MRTRRERSLMAVCEMALEIQCAIAAVDRRKATLSAVLPVMEASADELRAEIRRLSLVVMDAEKAA